MGVWVSADRSLTVANYALRRRFGFFELKPRFGWRQSRDHTLSMEISEGLLSEIEGDRPEAVSKGIDMGHPPTNGLVGGCHFSQYGTLLAD